MVWGKEVAVWGGKGDNKEVKREWGRKRRAKGSPKLLVRREGRG